MLLVEVDGAVVVVVTGGAGAAVVAVVVTTDGTGAAQPFTRASLSADTSATPTLTPNVPSRGEITPRSSDPSTVSTADATAEPRPAGTGTAPSVVAVALIVVRLDRPSGAEPTRFPVAEGENSPG